MLGGVPVTRGPCSVGWGVPAKRVPCVGALGRGPQAGAGGRGAGASGTPRCGHVSGGSRKPAPGGLVGFAGGAGGETLPIPRVLLVFHS